MKTEVCLYQATPESRFLWERWPSSVETCPYIDLSIELDYSNSHEHMARIYRPVEKDQNTEEEEEDEEEDEEDDESESDSVSDDESDDDEENEQD